MVRKLLNFVWFSGTPCIYVCVGSKSLVALENTNRYLEVFRENKSAWLRGRTICEVEIENIKPSLL